MTPLTPDIWHEVGGQLFNQRKYAEAQYCWSHLAETDFVRYILMAKCDAASGKFDEALALIDQSQVLYGGRNHEIWQTLGHIALGKEEYEEAERCFSKAMELHPYAHEAWQNRAHVLQVLMRWRESEMVYKQAISMFPQQFNLKTYLAMLLMCRGDYKIGLPLYENRKMHDVAVPKNKPQWAGEPLEGKRLVILCEQGLGDAIQFIRYVPAIRKHWSPDKVTVVARDPIYRVMRHVPGLDEVLVTGVAEEPIHDYFIPMLSIMGVMFNRFGVGPEFWGPDRYLEIKSRKREHRMKPQIGVCWQGSKGHANDAFRSIPLERLRLILDVPGVEFVNLNHELDGEAEAAGMRCPKMADLYDVAQVLLGLDAVVTVDTAIAHLAGALGVPTYCFIPHWPDWRWGLPKANALMSGEATPWYSSVLLFRAAEVKAWDAPIERVRKYIEALSQ